MCVFTPYSVPKFIVVFQTAYKIVVGVGRFYTEKISCMCRPVNIEVFFNNTLITTRNTYQHCAAMFRDCQVQATRLM